MLHHILQELEWVITFVLFTLVLFLIVALITIQPAIATITEGEIAPGTSYCRSEQVLTDEAGHKWEVMFFTEVDSPEVTALNLRLSGLSSSVNIESQKPLIIIAPGDRQYQATDIFLENSPLPSIGQYNLKNILPQLSTTDVLLEIPLVRDSVARLDIPKFLLKEWQEVSNRNYHAPLPKLPYTFELVC